MQNPRGVAVLFLAVFLVSRIVDYINQPEIEETVIGYNMDTVRAVVGALSEEGKVTFGEVIQSYQILQIRVKDGHTQGKCLRLSMAPAKYAMK